MKKTLLLLFFLMIIGKSFGQVQRIQLDAIHYDATTDVPLVYSNTFNDLSGYTLDFNLPFATHFLISGTHVEFTIQREDVLFYFFRNPSATSFDLQVNLYRFGILSAVGIITITITR